MIRPLTLHLKAALLCGLAAVVLALPLLWLPELFPSWQSWRPPRVSPRAEALVAIAAAFWVAWCVVDIPRRGLKILIWVATLWLLGSGIWLAGLYGYAASSLAPLAAAFLAGVVALGFSLSPAGSRKARWLSMVGERVSPRFLRRKIDESALGGEPQTKVVSVVEILWPGHARNEPREWQGTSETASQAARHFLDAGGYLERCDAEGARFVFGCWDEEPAAPDLVRTAWEWLSRAGGCASLTRGECVCGIAPLPGGPRWTLAGKPLRRALRMAVAARGYAASLLVEDSLASGLDDAWHSRRMAWWDFEGDRILLCQITGPSKEGSGDDLRRWNHAWEAFWSGDWATAESGFATLARERNDDAARIFAMRSSSARRHEAGL